MSLFFNYLNWELFLNQNVDGRGLRLIDRKINIYQNLMLYDKMQSCYG